jgi:hypothetical protein
MDITDAHMDMLVAAISEPREDYDAPEYQALTAIFGPAWRDLPIQTRRKNSAGLGYLRHLWETLDKALWSMGKLRLSDDHTESLARVRDEAIRDYARHLLTKTRDALQEAQKED